jgi:hypothetical protein
MAATQTTPGEAPDSRPPFSSAQPPQERASALRVAHVVHLASALPSARSSGGSNPPAPQADESIAAPKERGPGPAGFSPANGRFRGVAGRGHDRHRGPWQADVVTVDEDNPVGQYFSRFAKAKSRAADLRTQRSLIPALTKTSARFEGSHRPLQTLIGRPAHLSAASTYRPGFGRGASSASFRPSTLEAGPSLRACARRRRRLFGTVRTRLPAERRTRSSSIRSSASPSLAQSGKALIRPLGLSLERRI